MILNTDRLSLTPVTQGDAEFAYPLLSDAEVMAHWDVEPITDPDLVAAVINAQAEANEGSKATYWAIRTREGGFIGLCDLSDMDRWHRRAEIGFMIARKHWRQGYALEAMTAVLEYAAAQGFKRLVARTHVGNHPSENLLEKIGFEAEGYLRGHVERDGERRDCRLWGLML
jgi:ribosomal-protein-alanine N-acetyltransferase